MLGWLLNEIDMCGIDREWVSLDVHEGGHEVPLDDKVIDEMFMGLNKNSN